MPEFASSPSGPHSAAGRILVVDDDRRMASGLAEWLASRAWHAFAAGSTAEALRSPGCERCTACLVDSLLSDDGGRCVAAAVRAASPEAGIVAIVPAGGSLPAWADAFVESPARDDAVIAAIAAACEATPARSATTEPERASLSPTSGVIGQHPAMQHVIDVARRVARMPATVLVTGESGTGKSLLAREIHAASGRTGRFIEVACGSLAEPLLESELFGHAAGAFTGATSDRDGKFLLADGGTIFLDEIGSASPALQVKLLRVLQELEFEPVGSSDTHRVDARVILATNDDLAALVAAGRFRADLFWRVNVITIEMPPLRERASDIPSLAHHFLTQAAAQAGRVVSGFSAAALATLLRHSWPGNVRELQHAVERAVFLGQGDLIELSDLPPAVLATSPAGATHAENPLKQALAVPERQLIIDALERAGWRRDVAAQSLGINRTTLYKKLKRLGMDLNELQASR
jgi:DNA-binding NtrC family response regulator